MLSSGSTIASFEDEGRRGLRMASLIKELAYIVIDEGDVEAWSGFGTQLLGFEVQRHRSVLTMKMDPEQPRYFVLERKSNSSFPTLGGLTEEAGTLDVIGDRRTEE